MSESLFHRLLNGLSFANVGTVSEFHRVLERDFPVAVKTTPERVSPDNVLHFRRDASAFEFANPMLAKARLKP